LGNRTIFHRSSLGARVRSPLGAFQCHTVQFLEILTVPVFILEGDTHEVTGEMFGAAQGTGSLLVCNTADGGDIANAQTIVSWADTAIEFTFDDATGLPTDGIVWIKVINDDAATDSAPTAISAIISTVNVANRQTGNFAGIATALCGYSSSWNCSALMSSFGVELTSFGYAGHTYFFQNTPGFYLIGATSAKIVEYGYRDHIYNTATSGYEDTASFCTPEGLVSWSGSTSSGSGAKFSIWYEELASGGDVCAGTHGWTQDEDVYLAPKYPVSIQISAPADDAYIAENAQPETFTAYAYAAEGDIDATVEWASSADGSLGTGASVTPTLTLGVHTITASVTNAHGQYRHNQITVTVQALSITSIDPISGVEAGGTAIAVVGTGFTASTTVEFGGVEATSVVCVDSQNITCNTPAGTGAVDVGVFDGADSDSLVDGYIFSDLSVASIAPDNGTSAGGTSVTVTGAGFTSDCIVIFINDAEVFEEVATNIVFVNDTTITCDTPAGPVVFVDVVVFDTVTLQAATLVSGFEYT